MNEFLWVEKYRPQTVEDCILPGSLYKTFSQIVKGGELQNMLLTGTAGVGKTTVAKALCRELGLDFLVINGSEESGIDTLRNKIKQFASSISLSGGYKVVILDEADYLNPQSTQPALRGFIEEFSGNCRFILTCNFKNRIIEPLHSRCSVVEFNIPKAEKMKLASQFLQRVCGVLANENIDFDKKVVAEVITNHFPDWRRVLNELQRYSTVGRIDTGILASQGNSSVDDLVGYLKRKSFTEVRKWVAENTDISTAALFRNLYDSASTTMKPHSVAQLVLILADYQYKAAFVADQEINITACMTEIMANCEIQ